MKRKTPLQLRVDPEDANGAKIISALEDLSKRTGLSVNSLANMMILNGIPTVQKNLLAIHEPDKQAA